MANTIKLKRGSGSDPGVSDLVVGELAIRTDTGKLFTRKDDDSVAEISGGGIDDGDKGDVVVSNSGDTWTIDNGVVTSAKILDSTIVGGDIAETTISGAKLINGTLTNTQISASAAIAGTKISPDFGSQNIQTSGQLSIFGGVVQLGTANSSHGHLSAYESMTFNIDSDNDDTNRHFSWYKNAASGSGTLLAQLHESGNLDVSGGIDVTGDITVTGTVDGRDLSTDGSKLDGIESGATADMSASEILTLLKTVDGAGSGLDADTLDGVSSGSFLRTDTADEATGDITFSGGAGAATIAAGSDIRLASGTWSGESLKIQGHNNTLYLQGGSNGLILRGSDGGDMANFQNTVTTFHDAVNFSGDATFSGGANAALVSAGSDIRFPIGTWTGNSGATPKIQGHNHTLYLCGGTSGFIFREDGADRWKIDGSGHLLPATDSTYTIGNSSYYVSSVWADDFYSNSWIRNNNSGEGLYNQATGMHWYSGAAGYFDIGGGQSAQGIRFRDNHNGTIRGYVYYTNSNEIGFLDSDGQWAVKVVRDSRVELCINNTVEASIYPDTIRCEGAFFENNATVAANKTISDGYNAMSAGPITINNAVTVTVGSGESWTII